MHQASIYWGDGLGMCYLSNMGMNINKNFKLNAMIVREDSLYYGLKHINSGLCLINIIIETNIN